MTSMTSFSLDSTRLSLSPSPSVSSTSSDSVDNIDLLKCVKERLKGKERETYFIELFRCIGNKNRCAVCQKEIEKNPLEIFQIKYYAHENCLEFAKKLFGSLCNTNFELLMDVFESEQECRL